MVQAFVDRTVKELQDTYWLGVRKIMGPTYRSWDERYRIQISGENTERVGRVGMKFAAYGYQNGVHTLHGFN